MAQSTRLLTHSPIASTLYYPATRLIDMQPNRSVNIITANSASIRLTHFARVAGKVVIITGSSSSFGRRTAFAYIGGEHSVVCRGISHRARV